MSHQIPDSSGVQRHVTTFERQLADRGCRISATVRTIQHYEALAAADKLPPEPMLRDLQAAYRAALQFQRQLITGEFRPNMSDNDVTPEPEA